MAESRAGESESGARKILQPSESQIHQHPHGIRPLQADWRSPSEWGLPANQNSGGAGGVSESKKENNAYVKEMLEERYSR